MFLVLTHLDPSVVPDRCARRQDSFKIAPFGCTNSHEFTLSSSLSRQVTAVPASTSTNATPQILAIRMPDATTLLDRTPVSANLPTGLARGLCRANASQLTRTCARERLMCAKGRRRNAWMCKGEPRNVCAKVSDRQRITVDWRERQTEDQWDSCYFYQHYRLVLFLHFVSLIGDFRNFSRNFRNFLYTWLRLHTENKWKCHR